MNYIIEITNHFSDEISMLLIASLLGGIVGLERKVSKKSSGPKTFSLICLGSCLFTITSKIIAEDVPGADPGRIAAQIVTGIGFLGAGTIFRSGGTVNGLTTAAYIWFTAAVGILAGLGETPLAIIAVIISLLVIMASRIITWTFIKQRSYRNQNKKLEHEMDEDPDQNSNE